MSDFIESYERQLVEAASRQLVSRRRPSGRIVGRRRWPIRPGVSAAIVVMALIAAPALAATSGWDPFDDANRESPSPSTSSNPPSAELTDTLGVLRRMQVARDRGPLAQSLIRRIDNDVAGVHVAFVRLARQSPATLVVPVERFGLRTERLARRYPEIARALPPASRRRDGICLVIKGDDRTAAGSCGTLDQILSGYMLGSQGDTVYGMVPDGVASVRLERGDVATTLVVGDNMFVAGSPAPVNPGRGLWLASDGRVLKIIDYAKG